MLDILRMDITKDLLRKMAKEERCLFLALGHASNQVNALWKLVIILVNGDETEPVKQRLESAQTQIFVRLNIGAMQEAWRLIEDRFLKDRWVGNTCRCWMHRLQKRCNGSRRGSASSTGSL
jgi:hypothetical protein